MRVFDAELDRTHENAWRTALWGICGTLDNDDYPLSSAAAQDVLLDKQAPASDKRHCTRIALGRTRSRLSRRDDDLPACAPQLPRAAL
jgi:hypothetical protein